MRVLEFFPLCLDTLLCLHIFRKQQAVGDKWNIIGLDLKNEPRGKANWGVGDKSLDWGMAANNIATYIFQR